MRVYEFGPVTGRKVLLLHGISTSCQTLSLVARGLAFPRPSKTRAGKSQQQEGCRVLMFDLFGRGYSDGVGDLPHDARLYTSQCLFAMASSPLSWTGSGSGSSGNPGGFSIVAYSLGGGVAVHLATSLGPEVVRSLVLLAPAGLIRAHSFGLAARLIFRGGLVPERILAALTRRRLRQPIARSVKPNGRNNGPSRASARDDTLAATGATDLVDAAVAEVADPKTPEEVRSQSTVTAETRTTTSELVDDDGRPPLHQRVKAYVQWMVTHHPGFVTAFMSSLAHAPLTDQHDSWRLLASRLPGTTAIILGESDEIVDPHYYEEDALPLVGGRDHVLWTTVRGGHDFVMTNARDTLAVIYRFWGMDASD